VFSHALRERRIQRLRLSVVQRTGVLAKLRKVAHEDRRKEIRL
jgi:hypothetical protein